MSEMDDIHSGIELALTQALNHRTKCHWWEIIVKAQFEGAIVALRMMHEMCHILMKKYENDKGQLN